MARIDPRNCESRGIELAAEAAAVPGSRFATCPGAVRHRLHSATVEASNSKRCLVFCFDGRFALSQVHESMREQIYSSYPGEDSTNVVEHRVSGPDQEKTNKPNKEVEAEIQHPLRPGLAFVNPFPKPCANNVSGH